MESGALTLADEVGDVPVSGSDVEDDILCLRQRLAEMRNRGLI